VTDTTRPALHIVASAIAKRLACAAIVAGVVLAGCMPNQFVSVEVSSNREILTSDGLIAVLVAAGFERIPGPYADGGTVALPSTKKIDVTKLHYVRHQKLQRLICVVDEVTAPAPFEISCHELHEPGRSQEISPEGKSLVRQIVRHLQSAYGRDSVTSHNL
jgi:hypothetical protein